jgi:hypothetical protein
LTQEDLSNNQNHTNNREEELEKLQKHRATLVGEIDQTEKTASKWVGVIDGYTDQAIREYNKDIAALQDFGKKVEDEVKLSLDEVAGNAEKNITSALNYFNVYFMSMIISVIIIGALGGYLFSAYMPQQLAVFFLGWVSLSSIALVYLWHLPRTLPINDLEVSVKTENSKLKETVSKRPQSTHNLSPMKWFTVAASRGIRDLAGFSLELIPNGDKIIKHQSDQLKQQEFVDNFVFALRRYRIDAFDEANDLMVTESWRTDSVHSWLNDVSKDMSMIFEEIDPIVFRLMYYEFFDDKYAGKLWTKIQNNTKIIKQIAYILVDRKLVNAPDKEQSLFTISELLKQIPNYSLEEAKLRVSNFFMDLAEFKKSCEGYLDFYGLHIVEKKELISEFIPLSQNVTGWKEDVVSFIAEKIVSKQLITVKLLIQSGAGDQEVTNTWIKIIDSGELDELAAILTRKRIMPKHADFQKTAFTNHLKLAMIQNRDEFSLAAIETAAEKMENEILTSKYRIQRMISEFKLGPVSLDFINNYVPSNTEIIEESLLTILSQNIQTEIDDEILTLLYSSANGLDKTQDIYGKIVNTPKVEGLANLLVEKSFISKTKFTVNTGFLLNIQSSFNLSGFISVYVKYETLSESLEDFYPFLKANGVLIPEKRLELKEIISICPISSVEPIENQLEKLASNLVVKTVGAIILDDDQQSDLALAATALFMRTHGYSGYSSLCQKASRKGRDFATKTLFQYTLIVAEETLSGSHETLKNAITKAMSGIVDKENFEYFKNDLAAGKLAPNAVYLFSKFRQEVNDTLNKYRDNGFEIQTLKNYVDSIKELLNHAIDGRIVKEFLVNQVISAYLLTVPGTAPGIRLIERENENDKSYIELAEERLSVSEKDLNYLNLVRLSKGIGKATRVGLVPLDLNFEEFSKKFDKVWNLALKTFNENETDIIQVPLPCFLVRIFPSEDGLKEIMPSTDIKTRPIEVVKALIKESVNAQDSVSILSLLQYAPNAREALFKTIQAIFDNKKSTLKMMLASYDEILAKSPKLTGLFNDKKIDCNLGDEYKAGKSIFNLAREIAGRAEINSQQAFDEFNRYLKKQFEDDGLSKEENDLLISALFKQLRSIGIVSILQLTQNPALSSA